MTNQSKKYVRQLTNKDLAAIVNAPAKKRISGIYDELMIQAKDEISRRLKNVQ